MDPERRAFQRLNLTRALDGRFGDALVRLTNVSATGAQVEHETATASITIGSRAPLRFEWRGEEVVIDAEAVREDELRWGLRFFEQTAQLRRLIEESALELLRAQEANLSGDRESNVIGDETLTVASAGLRAGVAFVSWRFDGTNWKRTPALLPDQPPNGFTISSAEPDEQVALLRKTYESGDDEARNMIRILAEISVTR